MHMKLYVMWLVASLAAARNSATVETGQQPDLSLITLTTHQSPPNPVSVRLHPTFGGPTDASWIPTPPGFQLGTWYIAHSNQFEYKLWLNTQWTLSPLPGYTWPFYTALHDTTSEQLLANANTSAAHQVNYEYGVDYPLMLNGSVVADAYRYMPTGPVAPYNNTWQVLAWGYDTNGDAWEVVYETATIASSESMDFMARVPNGPSTVTLDAIYDAIRASGNERLVALLDAVAVLALDGGRDGTPYPTCNATCRTNAYAFA